MDVETPLGYVDFTTEKDLQRQRSKSLKKRKRVGNRRPIGEKIAKPSRAHTTPRAVVKHVPEPESDVEESDQGTKSRFRMFEATLTCLLRQLLILPFPLFR